MAGRTWCILGGGGSFAIHTAFHLLDHAAPKKVIGVGRNPLRAEPFSLGIDRRPGYEYHQRHIGHELDMLLELLDKERPEIIVNFAAQGEGAVSWRHSWRFFDTNCTALVALTEELSKRTWLERFIQIGTSELYGSCEDAVTEDAPIRPSSPYAASKAAFDLHLMSVHRFQKFPMNILRPCNAYGPGQLLHRIIPKAVLCGVTGRKLPLHGGGRAEKSYIHARDLAEAILLVAETAPIGAVYNVGAVRPVAIREIVERVAHQLDIPFNDLCEVTEDRLGQDARYWLDSSAIRHATGWSPSTRMADGIRQMIDWAQAYKAQLETLPTDYVLHA